MFFACPHQARNTVHAQAVHSHADPAHSHVMQGLNMHAHTVHRTFYIRIICEMPTSAILAIKIYIGMPTAIIATTAICQWQL